jgi:hypothetical protein
MDGPGHYQAAEEHLTDAFNQHWGTPEEGYHLRAAQAHATLALTAAFAYGQLDHRHQSGMDQTEGWRKAIG